MKIIFIIATLCFLQQYECWSKSTLVINNKEVEKASYRIEAVGTYLKFTFEDATFVLGKMNDTLIFFDDETGVDSVVMPCFYNVKEEIHGILKIEGVPIGERITIYSANGNQQYSAFCHESSVSIDIGNFPKGVYIIRVNEQSIKFIKK